MKGARDWVGGDNGLVSVCDDGMGEFGEETPVFKTMLSDTTPEFVPHGA